MRYLITGAQGFVGRYLTARLLRDPDAEVVGVGRSEDLAGRFVHGVTVGGERRRAPLPAGLEIDPRRYRYRSIDILDQEALAAHLRANKADVVFHLAASLAGDRAANLAAANVGGAVSLLGAVMDAGCDGLRLVLGSSGAVYGAQDALPIGECAPERPAELYGVTKLVAEHAAAAAAGLLGVEVVFARIFNIIGPGADERHAPARFAQQVAGLACGAAGPIEVGDLGASRDFIDVRDVAEALCVLAARGAPGEVYNVGSGAETRLESLLEQMTRGVSPRPEVRRTHFRAGEVRRHAAAIDKLRALGITPHVPLADSLDGMLAYYAALIRQKALP